MLLKLLNLELECWIFIFYEEIPRFKIHLYNKPFEVIEKK